MATVGTAISTGLRRRSPNHGRQSAPNFLPAGSGGLPLCDSIKIPIGRHESVTRQCFANSEDQFCRKITPGMKTWRLHLSRSRSVSEEMVNRLVGVGESVAILHG